MMPEFGWWAVVSSLRWACVMWAVMWIGGEGYSVEYSKFVSHFPKQNWLNSSLKYSGVLYRIVLTSNSHHCSYHTRSPEWGDHSFWFLEVWELMMRWIQQGKGQCCSPCLWFCCMPLLCSPKAVSMHWDVFPWKMQHVVTWMDNLAYCRKVHESKLWVCSEPWLCYLLILRDFSMFTYL